MPDVTLFGTNGGNDGYGSDVGGENFVYVRVPLIGMPGATPTVLGDSLHEFLQALSAGA